MTVEKSTAATVTHERQVKAKYNAIFIGLWQSNAYVTLEDGSVLKIMHLEDSKKLFEELETFTPQIISQFSLSPPQPPVDSLFRNPQNRRYLLV